MKKILLLLLIVSLLACGCLSSKNDTATTATPTDVAGTYTSSDGNVSMTIPANVLNAYSKPAANIDANPPAIADTTNLSAAGSSYTMSPVNAVFTTPVTLSFKYPTTLPAGISPDMLRVYNYVGGVWTLVKGAGALSAAYGTANESTQYLDTANTRISLSVNDFKNPMFRLLGDIRINKLAVSTVKVAESTTDATKVVLTVAFNKELDPTTAVAGNFTVTVGATALTIPATDLTYDAATKTITIVLPKTGAPTAAGGTINITEDAAIKVEPSTAVQDVYNQPYDPASQTSTTDTTTTVDLTLDPVTGLTPSATAGAGGAVPVLQKGGTFSKLSWTATTYNNSSAGITYTIQCTAAGAADFSGTLKEYTTTATEVSVEILEASTAFNWAGEWDYTTTNTLKSYLWRVKAVYDADATKNSTSTETSKLTYDKENLPPSAPSAPLVGGATADANTVATPTTSISWTGSTDPEGATVTYAIEFDTKSDFTSGATVTKTGIATTTYALSTVNAELTDDTTYYWRVQGVDPRGNLGSDKSAVSQFFYNNANDTVVIGAHTPTNGAGIANSAEGLFNATVTLGDSPLDTYKYKVEIYTELAGTTLVGSAEKSSLPIAMTDITNWASGHPVEDTQDYYWKLTVTEDNVTYNTPASTVVSSSPLQKFVKSDGDSAPTVTLNDSTVKDGTTNLLGKDTAFTWTATDTDNDDTTLYYEVGIFTSDSDSAVKYSYKTAANVLTTTITTIVGTATLDLTANDVTYYYGVRAYDDAAADKIDSSKRQPAYGSWVRKSFIYKEAPKLTNITIGNVTDSSFTVIWRTDSESTTTDDKLYYTTDGNAPTTSSTSVANTSNLSKVHYVDVTVGSNPYTEIKFMVQSKSTVGLIGQSTVQSVTLGQATSSAPPPPTSFLVNLTNSTDGHIGVCKIKVTANGTDFETYNFIAKVSQNRLSLDTGDNRQETANAFTGKTGGFIDTTNFAITDYKVYSTVYHNDTEAKSVSGEYSIVAGAFQKEATVDVQ